MIRVPPDIVERLGALREATASDLDAPRGRATLARALLAMEVT